MSESIFPYYERELRFLRHLTAGFAQRYPKAARRLQLSPDADTEECLDPHVERLIQAFALTAAGIHRRLDDDFPEISHTLLELLAPHLLRPMPSMTIVKLVPDPQRDRPLHIPRDRPLYTKQINGTACRFQTTYPVTLWPMRTGDLSVDVPGRLGLQSEAAAVLRLELECNHAPLSACLELTSLRFYLHGPDQYALYDLLFGPGVSVYVRNKAGGAEIHPLRLEPVGFEQNAAMLPHVPRSIDGYRLLREYFACPNKFLFFDLHFDAASREPLGRQVEILFLLRQHPGRKYQQNSFQLGCTPAINLFSLTAEPISLDHQQPEYLVEPNVNAPDAYEIYQIEQVSSTAVKGEKAVDFEPIYSMRHGGSPAGYFLAMRRPTQAKERLRNETTAAAPGAPRAPRPPPKDRPRTEVYLATVDAQLKPSQPALKSLTIRTLCTNGALPSEAGAHPDFTLDSKEAIGIVGIEALVPPTVRRPPHLDRGTHWRLISHLSLNYLSIGDATADAKSTEALSAFRELLTLYAPLADTDSELSAAAQIEGITKISSKRSVAIPDGFEGPCRGIELTIAFNPELYQKGSILLLAGVLERFLARYVSLNSFIKLIATTHTGREIKQWPPRSGDQILF